MLRVLAKALSRVFFRRIYVSGTPYIGPHALWAANHQSGIVDPAILFALAPVPLRPISKHTLWSHPVMRPLLQMTAAIPVRRTQDMMIEAQAHKQALESGVSEKDWRARSNSDAFQAVADAIVEGGRVLIFPEGISHDQPYLQKLKTGIARMALQAMARSKSEDFSVVLQPVAIDYFEKDEYRSDLALHFCEPIAVTNSETPVEDLITALQASLLDGLAQFSTWDEKRNWLFLFEVAYARQPQSAREFRLFVDSYRPLFNEDPVFLARVQSIRRMLLAMNISPAQIIWGEAHERKRSFFKMIITRGLFYFIVAAPVEYLCLLVWFIPQRIAGFLANISTRDRDVVATMKIAHGLYVFAAWIILGTLGVKFVLMAIWPDINEYLAVLIGFTSGPLALFLGLWSTERHDYFPGYWRLAKLRLLFPRGWREIVAEWREMSEAVLEKIGQVNQRRIAEEQAGKMR
jgi:1-acyl-sn-glycerol-3-phosphate acyltransferase